VHKARELGTVLVMPSLSGSVLGKCLSVWAYLTLLTTPCGFNVRLSQNMQLHMASFFGGGGGDCEKTGCISHFVPNMFRM
jgi:hypothetical protein